VLLAHHDRLWNRELASLSPVSHADQMVDARLRADLGAPDTRYLITASADSVEAVLQSAERLQPVLSAMVQSGALAGFESPSFYLPSMATQRRRQGALPPAAELQRRLSEAVVGLPVRAERLRPFVEEVQRARAAAPIVLADLQGTSLSLALDALLFERDGRWTALIPLRAPVTGPSAFVIDAGQVRQALARAAVADTLVIDLKTESDRLYGGYFMEAVALSGAGVVAILLLLYGALRSAARVLRVAAPLVAAVLVVAAGLVLLGQSLTLLHLVGMLLVIAVGSNYALFFEGDAQRGRTPEPATLASLLLANTTTVIGFGILAFSHVPVLNAIGSTVGPGAVLALLFAAILLRPGTGVSDPRA